MSKRSLYLSLMLVSLLLLGALLGFLWKRAIPVIPPSLTKLPEVEVIPQVPQATASAFRLTVALPDVKKLPVYWYSFPNGDPDERARGWARALGFVGDLEKIESPLFGTSYYVEKGAEVLTIDAKAARLSYSIDLAADKDAFEGSFLPSPEQAALIVERTVRDLGFYSPLLKFDPSKTQFFQRGIAQPRPASAASADFLAVYFGARIGDYPLYLDGGQSLVDPLIAWVGKDGKLLYLEYHVVGSIGEKIGDYRLKNREEVLEALNKGEGVVVGSSFLGKPDISAVVINDVSVGYLLPLPDVNVLQPIYVLRGTASDKSGEPRRSATDRGERVSLTIYLPAVKKT